MIGLFSYRSFALAAAGVFDRGEPRADGRSVSERIEGVAYIRDTDEFQRLFNELDRHDAVLVGSRAGCDGIITAMGALRYLYRAASPFLLVAEIELGLRRLIQYAVEGPELERFARVSLTHRGPERAPTTLKDMSFNDCLLLVAHGENWERFQPIFQADRNRTYTRLRELRDLRNDVFHFRRALAEPEHRTLTESRDWDVPAVVRLRLGVDLSGPAGKVAFSRDVPRHSRLTNRSSKTITHDAHP